MKTVSGTIVSSKPVTLSKAANILSNFINSDNGASQSVSTYLRRTCAAFNELVHLKKHHKRKKHQPMEESSSKSDINPRNSEEDEARVLENGGWVNKKFDHDPVEIVEKKEKKKKKKKDKGSLGNGEFEEDNEVVKENSEEKKKKKKRKNAEVDEDEIGNSKKKKRRRTEVDE